MAIFLLVLKIIGITLLAIICLLLLIVLAVLFVPVKYMLSGNKDREDGSDIYAASTASWFLGIVKMLFYFNGHDTSLRIRVFGIPLKTREEKEEAAAAKRKKKEDRIRKKKERKNKKEKREKKKEPEYEMLEYDEASGDIKQVNPEAGEREAVITYQSKDSQFDKEDTEDKEDREEESRLSKIYTVYDRIHDRTVRQKDKISKLIRNISLKVSDIRYYYDALTNDSRNKEAIDILKKNLKILLKSMKPKKLKGHLDYGFDDPADTGMILAAAAVMYPLYGGRFLINPDFENRLLAFDLILKGRIYIFVLVRVALAVFFNKKVKRFIKIMKKENSNGR